MRKALIIAAIILVFIVVITLRFINNQRGQPAEVVASTTRPVEVVRARRGEIRQELQLSGTIEANSHVTVFPEVSGIIIDMRVDEGSRVSKGETLAIIEHETLELQMHQAEAAHQSAEIAYDQTRKLAKIRVDSQVAQARAQLAAAETSLQQVLDLAQTRTLSQTRQAEAGLASLQANLEKIKRGARDEDRKQAQASANQAQASLTNAKSNYNRMNKLFETGAISAQSFENSQTQLDVANAQYEVAVEQKRLIENGAREEDIRAMEAQVEGAEALLKVARAQAETKTWEKDTALAESQVEATKAILANAEALEEAKSWEAEINVVETAMAQAKAALDFANALLDDATITAPISGIVSNRHLDLGGMATLSAPIFEIVDMDTVKAVVGVIESDLSKLDLRGQGLVQVDALTNPVDGTITFISPILEPSSRSARVEFTIDNSGMKLRPGMFAKVTITVAIHENTILIPRSVVIEDSVRKTRSVFVVDDGLSKRRRVEFGLSDGGIVEIVAGLSEAEQVVTAGQHSLKDGQTVTVVNP